MPEDASPGQRRTRSRVQALEARIEAASDAAERARLEAEKQRVHDEMDRHRDSQRRARANPQYRVAERLRSREAERAARARRQQEQEQEQERARKAAEQRARKNERSARWHREHPEYRAEWMARNPEKVAAQRQRNRERNGHKRPQYDAASYDRHTDEAKARAKRWRERNPDYAREYMKKYMQDPEHYAAQLKRNREAAKLKRRLAALGLPPRKVRRTTAPERRANERDAAAFFTDESSRVRYAEHERLLDATWQVLHSREAELRKLATETVAARRRSGLEPGSVEENILARAVGEVLDRDDGFEHLTTADIRSVARIVAEGRERAQRAAERERADAARAEQRVAFREALTRLVKDHGARLRSDAEMENSARGLADKPALPVDALMYRIAVDELRERIVMDRLNGEDVRGVVAMVRAERSDLRSASFPARAGSTAGLGRAAATPARTATRATKQSGPELS